MFQKIAFTLLSNISCSFFKTIGLFHSSRYLMLIFIFMLTQQVHGFDPSTVKTDENGNRLPPPRVRQYIKRHKEELKEKAQKLSGEEKDVLKEKIKAEEEKIEAMDRIYGKAATTETVFDSKVKRAQDEDIPSMAEMQAKVTKTDHLRKDEELEETCKSLENLEPEEGAKVLQDKRGANFHFESNNVKVEEVISGMAYMNPHEKQKDL